MKTARNISMWVVLILALTAGALSAWAQPPAIEARAGEVIVKFRENVSLTSSSKHSTRMAEDVSETLAETGAEFIAGRSRFLAARAVAASRDVVA